MRITCGIKSCVYKNRADKCILKHLSIDEAGKCGDCLTADYNSLFPLNHLYYGGNGGVYCRIRHEIINNLDGCYSCSLLAGSLQGEGIECLWDDVLGDGFMQFHDPKRELLRVSNLIDMGYFDRYPSVNGERCHKYTIYNENFKRDVADAAAKPSTYTVKQK